MTVGREETIRGESRAPAGADKGAPTEWNSRISRRTIVKSAAWSVPVIAVTVASPAMAASACPSAPGVLTATAADVNGSGLLASLLVTVPSNVKTVTYTVIGGSGGGWHSVNGQAATITGTFNGPALGGPALLTLIAGGGGQGGGQFAAGTSTTVRGGTGYGNGGDTTIQNWNTSLSVGGGGSGSAILSGGSLTSTPLVVAGGGGGTWPFNASGGGGTTSSWRTGVTADSAPSVSNAGPTTGAGQSGRSMTGWYEPVTNGTRTNEGNTGSAGGASGATGGTAATATVQPGTTGTGTRTGSGGGNHTTSGGNGGNGALPFSPDAFGNYLAAGGGGGGGGYAGGAGGSLFYWTTLDSNGHPFITAGGSGGGGSSYADPSVTVGAQGVTASSPNGGQGAPGSVLIGYTC